MISVYLYRVSPNVHSFYNSLENIIDVDSKSTDLYIITENSEDSLVGKYFYTKNSIINVYNDVTGDFEEQVVKKSFLMNFYAENNNLLFSGTKESINRFINKLIKNNKDLNVEYIGFSFEKILKTINTKRATILSFCLNDVILLENIIGKFYGKLDDNTQSKTIIKNFSSKIQKITFEIETQGNLPTKLIATKAGTLSFVQNKEFDWEYIISFTKNILEN
ncbi:hypothetical protein [Akkermansia muciniphila]|uniref:hypothetical protein n=1 Tax=Akkermansia muciniphila TaxID=239935 RepID=UPI00319EAF6B